MTYLSKAYLIELTDLDGRSTAKRPLSRQVGNVMSLQRFNIRVYGLLIHNGDILLTDELVRGNQITKFPGGGLELGEGPEDCIVREFMEETGLAVRVLSHVYTTGFFQPSAFNAADQIISIYYRVESTGSASVGASAGEIDIETGSRAGSIVRLRWASLSHLQAEDLSLPIDRHVVLNCLPSLAN